MKTERDNAPSSKGPVQRPADQRLPVGNRPAARQPPAYGIDLADAGAAAAAAVELPGSAATRHPPSEAWHVVQQRQSALQAKDAPGLDAVAADCPPVAAGARAQASSGGGNPLPRDVQSKMEGAFGTDLSPVRTHDGSLAQSVGALAVTQGADIHFAPGLYAPHTNWGQQLLGHELTHVLQQASGRVQATRQRKGWGVNSDTTLEREADEMGARAARGQAVHLPGLDARRNAGTFRAGIQDFHATHPAAAIRQGQGRVLGRAPTTAHPDSSGVLQCYGSVDYAANVWPAATGKKTTNLKNEAGDFKVDHGLTQIPGAGDGEYEIRIEMTPTKKTQGSTIRFVQAVRRGTTPGNWSTKAADSGMDADRARRAAEGGWRVDRADPTTDKTPFYSHQIDGGGALQSLGNAGAGTYGGAKPFLYDAPAVLDPSVLEFSSDAMDDTTGASFGKVAWGFQYSSAAKTYQEETPRLLPASTNWFLNLFSEDRRRVAGERAGRQKWNEVYGAGGTGKTAGDANVKKVLGV